MNIPSNVGPNVFMREAYNDIKNTYDLDLIDFNHQCNASTIDKFIACELEVQDENYKYRENKYVNSQLNDCQDVQELRNIDTKQIKTTSSSSSSDKLGSNNDEKPTSSKAALRSQRATSTRQGRIKKKVDKTMLQSKHHYITNALKQSADNLYSIRYAIRNVEIRLGQIGYDQDAIEKIRNAFGVVPCMEEVSEAIRKVDMGNEFNDLL